MTQKRFSRGFTLVEMIVVVAILGILGAMAFASYNDSVRRSGRADAKVSLSDIAQRLQRCFTATNAYNSASCGVVTELNGEVLSKDGFYTIRVSDLTQSTYTLTASPVTTKRQSKDSACTAFVLTQTGQRSATGSDPDSCW